MDQVFAPEKASKLVIRVKMDASSNPSVIQDETEFSPVAIAILFIVVLLTAGGGYYYSSLDDGLLIPEIETQNFVVEALPKVLPETALSKTVLSKIEQSKTPEAIPVVEAEISSPMIAKEIIVPVEIENKIEDVKPLEMVVEDEVVETPALVTLAEVEVLVEKNIESVIESVVVDAVLEPTRAPEKDFSANIKRAQFTNDINQREPVDFVEGIVPAKSEGIKRMYFFSELLGLKGQTIRHQWLRNNKLETELKFNVKGNRWRVNSSKRLNPRAMGNWQVNVVNEAGNILISKNFEYK